MQLYYAPRRITGDCRVFYAETPMNSYMESGTEIVQLLGGTKAEVPPLLLKTGYFILNQKMKYPRRLQRQRKPNTFCLGTSLASQNIKNLRS